MLWMMVILTPLSCLPICKVNTLEIMTHEIDPAEVKTDGDKVYYVCKGSCSDRKMMASCEYK